jgi:sodium-dependent phosphate cotransporter
MSTQTAKKILLLIIILYLFIFSIQLMGSSFKMMGEGFAKTLIETTSNPVVGLLIGILATSIIQSSSTTTSITVGFVAGGALTLQGAIPIIMGANIGTTVTNTMVSIGHVTRIQEFRRAFSAATVHDFFNILAVIILFPLEMIFHPLEKSATALSKAFVGVGVIDFLSPLKSITEPVVDIVKQATPYPLIILIGSLFLLFFTLFLLVKIMRSMILAKLEIFLDKYLFKNDFTAFLLAIAVTSIIQSSSITTSIIVPLVGAGVLTVRKIFPYTLGANVGTTITSMLASFATLNPVAVTVAFSHLLFNTFGIIILYPLKWIPIRLSEAFARLASKSKKSTILFLSIYFLVPTLILIFILFVK